MAGLLGRSRVAVGAALMMLAGLCVTAAAALSALSATVSPATVLLTHVPTQGIDVSALQHPRNAVINWPDVAAAGNTFAAIKTSEATYYVNPYFASDAAQAASAGLFVMPYAFANPFPARVNGSAKAQADAAVRQLTSANVPASQMLPLALDMEPDPYAASQNSSQCYGLSHAAMVTWIRQFMAEAQLKTGMESVIYTTAPWWKVCTGNSAAFGSYPLWIASHGKSNPALPASWTRYTFWQHTDTGTVPGVPGSADEDFLGPVPHARPVANPISLAQFPPPAPDGFTYWLIVALLVVSVGIAAIVGFAVGFNRSPSTTAPRDRRRPGWPVLGHALTAQENHGPFSYKKHFPPNESGASCLIASIQPGEYVAEGNSRRRGRGMIAAGTVWDHDDSRRGGGS